MISFFCAISSVDWLTLISSHKSHSKTSILKCTAYTKFATTLRYLFLDQRNVPTRQAFINAERGTFQWKHSSKELFF